MEAILHLAHGRFSKLNKCLSFFFHILRWQEWALSPENAPLFLIGILTLLSAKQLSEGKRQLSIHISILL